MSDPINLELVDVDGAIREAEEAVAGDTRADLFRKAAIGGGAVLGSGLLVSGFPEFALAGRPSKREDVKILNFALTLEFLESEFYKLALANANLEGEVLAATRVVNKHEATHVKFLRNALGGKAVKKPSFDFNGATDDAGKFLDLAVVLEDTGVTAYSGQAPRITQTPILKAATSILTVEARHASRFRSLNSQSFAPRSFDKPASMGEVLKAAKPFIK